jgi:hypothetical protein
MHPIRNSAKALIIRDGQLLVIKKCDQEIYCILPVENARNFNLHPGKNFAKFRYFRGMARGRVVIF